MEPTQPLPPLPSPARRLVGVGVGPGDPELLTVKAVRELTAADVVLVPATERSTDGQGRAERIVLAACPQTAGKMLRAPFTMGTGGVTLARREAWETSARLVLDAYRDGASAVCVATVGDPSVYSTFAYLAETVRAHLPEVAIEVVPGITAMQALAAASTTPLVQGSEVLALVPLTAGLRVLEQVLSVADTVVVYKAGRHLSNVLDVLRRHGRTGVSHVGVDIGLPSERVLPADQVPPDSVTGYFSTVLCAPDRPTLGGRL